MPVPTSSSPRCTLPRRSEPGPRQGSAGYLESPEIVVNKALDDGRRHNPGQLCHASDMVNRYSTVHKHDKRLAAIDAKKPMITGVLSRNASPDTPDRMGFNSRSHAPGPGRKISQTTRYNSAMAVGEP